MATLCIADPPYLGRATRWYGGGRGSGGGRHHAPDVHPAAATWDYASTHTELVAQLDREYDGWAIAATAASLTTYLAAAPDARVLIWNITNAAPSGSRIHTSWEPVIVRIPPGRTSRAAGLVVKDTLTAANLKKAKGVKGADVVPGSLTGKGLRDGSLTGADIADGSIGADQVDLGSAPFARVVTRIGGPLGTALPGAITPVSLQNAVSLTTFRTFIQALTMALGLGAAALLVPGWKDALGLRRPTGKQLGLALSAAPVVMVTLFLGKLMVNKGGTILAPVLHRKLFGT